MKKRSSKRKPGGEHFRSVIADWQLRLQTELKQASSLPTAMFDASDPMLEARLAESTEGLFRLLQDQPMPSLAPRNGADRSLELVTQEELSALLAAAARADFGTGAFPRLDENRDEEFYAILGDTCLRGPATQQQRARAVLQQQSGATGSELGALATAISQRIVQSQQLSTIDDKALLALCHLIAVAALSTDGGAR
ncbi:MAG: hypothetical protein EXS02_06065 [Planctomycetes bacterium]|nr:hypothetical protein [Planctomycetota bacterium]